MASGKIALVTPALLQWARTKAGFSVEEVSSKLKVLPEIIEQWESGEVPLTMTNARDLAAFYKRPLAVFYLPTPPIDFEVISEFRRLPGRKLIEESPSLRFTMREAFDRRQSYIEIASQMDLAPPPFNAGLDPTVSEDLAGATIRDILGVSWAQQLRNHEKYAALRLWRTAVEALGILVFQTGKVPLEEMRGTCIPHGPYPVILLNSNDSPRGRVFSLIHEFIHILFGNAGHLTSESERQTNPEQVRLERISNRFAAATLMPKSDFTEAMKSYPEAALGSVPSLRSVSERIGVSPEAILRRMVSLGIAKAQSYKKFRREQEDLDSSKPKGTGPRPMKPEVRVMSSLGRPFVETVILGYQNNLVSSAEIVDHFGLKFKYLEQIEGHLMRSRITMRG